jgi:DHA2 family methylenomycin A resistance protein-like MFS transporter
MRLLAICLAYFMVILDATIVNVALPDVQGDLGASVGTLQWVVDGYTLSFAALLLTGGTLADRLGARRVLLAGLGAFTAASVACALAPSAGFLVAARVVQGASAAATVPASLALLRAAYDSPAARARAVGAWGAVAGIAAASGPVLGGVLVTGAGWRTVFAVNVPVGVAAVALVLRALPDVAPQGRRGGLDLPGQVLAALSLTAIVAALIQSGGLAPVLAVAVLAVAGLVGAAAFLVVERRSPNPMLPLGLCRRPRFAAPNVVGLLINLGFYGQLFAFNLFLQGTRGLSALAAGAALLPEGIFVSLSSALSGRLSARMGVRPVMLGGLTLGACGLAGLALCGRTTPYALLVLPLAATGSGMALTMPAATTAAMEAAPAERAGIAAGILNAARQLGGAIGVALVGALLASGLHASLGVAAAAFAVGALVTWRAIPA